MKIRLVHFGLLLAFAVMLALWMMAREREDAAAKALAEPDPVPGVADPTAPAPASPPEARAYQDRLAFERSVRAFLREAPQLDDDARTRRAMALTAEIERREQSRELSADEAVMLRIGLIHAAVTDEAERIRQAQSVAERYRKRSEARQAALAAQQQRDEQFRQYKAAEARIVSETLAMSSYPDGMSRDDYLRMRLQQARDSIYGTPAPQPAPR
ncbi:MAG: hypothetical protein ACOY82_08645 [Pseudomonadota bacterium]